MTAGEREAAALEALASFSRRGGGEAEIYLCAERERTLSRRDGAFDALETGESAWAAVRVLRGGRCGFSAAGACDAAALGALFSRAESQLALSEAGAPRALPAPRPPVEDAAFAASLRDPDAFTREVEELSARLAEAEAAARDEPRVRRLLRSELCESSREVLVASTRGVLARESSTAAALSLAAAAEEGAETHVGEAVREARGLGGLDPAAAGREAAFRAAALLGAGRARGGRRAVVFSPAVGAELLELLSGLLSAEEVQAGRSLLAGRLGAKIASREVTLHDAPRRPGAPASALFDDEGLPSADKTMVEGGRLSAFFYDASSAAREGLPSNASGWRASAADAPSPSASNLILAPGGLSREALLSGTRGGLLALDMLGGHMIDPVSGEFSVGVSGLILEGGRPGRPFKGAMLSGNLLELLERVDAVAADLEFHGPFGCPSFRAAGLDVAG